MGKFRSKSGYRSGFRYAPALRTGLRIAKRAYNSYSKTKQSKVRDMPSLTNQFDSRTLYRRKSAPRRVVRRTKQFSNRVTGVQIKNAGTQIILKESSGTLTSAANNQTIHCFYMYGSVDSTGEFDDLTAINSEYVGAENKKYHFRSCVMDLEIKNHTSTDTMIFEVYEFILRRSVPKNATDASLTTWFRSQYADPDVIGNALVSAVIGMGPFQNSTAMSYMKIIKKKMFVLSAGQVYTLQLRNHSINQLYADNISDYYGIRNWTKGYIISSHCLFNGTVSPAASYTYLCRRWYNLAVLESSTAGLGSLP